MCNDELVRWADRYRLESDLTALPQWARAQRQKAAMELRRGEVGDITKSIMQSVVESKRIRMGLKRSSTLHTRRVLACLQLSSGDFDDAVENFRVRRLRTEVAG